MSRIALLLSSLAALLAPAAALAQSPAQTPAQTQAPSQSQAAWVQMTGQGAGMGAEVRAVAAAGACPQAMIDGQARAMAQRAPVAADFPMVCSLTLPARVRSLTVDGQTLSPPGRPVRRIVIIGDTGCRVIGSTAQACNDARAWPFAAISRLAAAKSPDLVIHVGDYYYRESACPPNNHSCAGTPFGDHWDTWTAEFFDPARPLLQAAPWIFARGNHETCSRGGRGWDVLLDVPAPPLTGCNRMSPPFTVHIGDLSLYVIDSADADDRKATKDNVGDIADQLDKLGSALDGGLGWIITHRPIWGLAPVARAGPLGPFEVGLNFTEQAAVRGRALSGVQMIVSGHVHHFSAISFGPRRPAQLIVGTGGDVGEPADKPQVYRGQDTLDGLEGATFTFSRYGYYLMEKDGEDWTGVFHDADDIVRATCRLHLRALACKAPG
jgi:hypothetical protein